MTRRTHVCAVVGCGELQPCPRHAPDPNAHRSPWRDRDKQKWFRKAVLIGATSDTDGRIRCQRCGKAGVPLQAHHDRPGWDPDHGRALCDDCHRALDNMARPAWG